MKKFFAAAGAAGILAASTIASLADIETRAVIASVDPEAGTVTLNTGQTLNLPEGFDAAELSVGSQIEVDYDAATMDILTFDVVTDGDVMQDTKGDN